MRPPPSGRWQGAHVVTKVCLPAARAWGFFPSASSAARLPPAAGGGYSLAASAIDAL